jgi:hypothetical protein
MLELAAGTGEFFLRHVPQTGAAAGAFFGYLAGDRTPIHNANMLACALLARLSPHLDGAEEAARTGVEYTLARQRPDGSWPYGELPHLDWVDNFHTGYVLECLIACADAGVDGGTEEAIESGLDYYRSELFLPDGTPKYRPDSVYPIDSQCVAQGIQTFALASRRLPGALEHAHTVYQWARATMRRRDGAFAFQRRRLWINQTPHVRWTVAPMLLALARLLRATEASG